MGDYNLRLFFFFLIVMVGIGFLGGSVVKNLFAMHETWVQSLGWEDPLEKEMATHSSAVALEIPWTAEPGGLHPCGCQRAGHHLETKQQQTKWFSRSKCDNF